MQNKIYYPDQENNLPRASGSEICQPLESCALFVCEFFAMPYAYTELIFCSVDGPFNIFKFLHLFMLTGVCNKKNLFVMNSKVFVFSSSLQSCKPWLRSVTAWQHVYTCIRAPGNRRSKSKMADTRQAVQNYRNLCPDRTGTWYILHLISKLLSKEIFLQCSFRPNS